MDLNLLEVFVAVADLRSFSAAARSLQVPTSTASRQVARLEAELKLRLFHRTTRHVTLTSDGAALRARVAPALEALQASVRVPDALAGTLRLTAPPDLGALLAPALAIMAGRYPQVHVDLWLTARQVNLVAEGFDAAIRGSLTALPDSSLVAKKLTPIELHVYAAPSLKEHTTWIAMRGLRVARGLPPPQIVVDDFDFLRELLTAGAGVGFLPKTCGDPYVAAGLLVRVMPKLSRSGSNLVLLHAARPDARVVAFRELLLATI